MQLVITEKPSVAKSIAEVLHATEHKKRVSAGKWLSGVLVCGASGRTG